MYTITLINYINQSQIINKVNIKKQKEDETKVKNCEHAALVVTNNKMEACTRLLYILQGHKDEGGQISARQVVLLMHN